MFVTSAVALASTKCSATCVDPATSSTYMMYSYGTGSRSNGVLVNARHEYEYHRYLVLSTRGIQMDGLQTAEDRYYKIK